MLLCGSAMSVMGGLLPGTAPLRGRAGLEMVVRPFDHRRAAAFRGISDARPAAPVHAVVGGTPAYRREFVRGDVPSGLDDFDEWVIRTVLNAEGPLFREARYLLAEETEIRDPSLYHSVLAAVADGNTTSGGIAGYVGRKSNEIAHPLRVLEDSHLLVKEPDLFRPNRSYYRVAEPLVISWGPSTWHDSGARDLLTAKGFDTRDTVLTCCSGAGFGTEAASDVRLVTIDDLYA
ncbi:AAA family ATPase [Streptosporangium sandarakinum]|uniref:AAA family ATPase n=1 Tax=Streptosporangium sandarakinum TaxID=1260955 RepID=UPI00343B231F